MAIAFDASSNLNTFTDSTTVTLSHTPSGVPGGALCLIGQSAKADHNISATYGGTPMVEMTNSPFIPVNVTQQLAATAFFLGSSVPAGTQDLVLTKDGSFLGMCIVIITLTGNDMEENVTEKILDSSFAGEDPSALFAIGSTTSFVAEVWCSGEVNISEISPRAGWTDRGERGHGNRSSGVYTYNTIGDSDVTVGYIHASGDEGMILAVAVKESVVTPVGGPRGPLGQPFHGPFGGPI